ncbi:hypothetical protein GCM10011380_18470 [Sphingomonas metalli]|uniref:Uncharacterized protein n=1 Tax=Sphingomonas metalli TaxID=1779358 RepID=A0A916T5G3_9SPHN|nr:hypothetical protein [Sphingomonas metalli]GGB29271.1 hypothetical protein GCM10011380_18470 [Sphingomonas metalli]
MTSPPAIHVEPLFATPVILDRPDAVPIDRGATMRQVEAALRQQGRSSAAIAPGPAVQPIIDHAVGLANRATAQTNGAGPIHWHAAVTGHAADGHHGLPIAPEYEAFWKALFVLGDGQGAEASGRIVLADPRLPAPMMEAANVRLRLRLDNPGAIYAPEVSLPAAAGDMVLMPGWLGGRWHPAPGHDRTLLLSITLLAPLSR